MRGGTGMCRRSSTGGGAGGGGAFGGEGGGEEAAFSSEIHWLARLVVSPIFASTVFNPLNSALARETSPAAASPMEGMCRGGGAGEAGRSRTS